MSRCCCLVWSETQEMGVIERLGKFTKFADVSYIPQPPPGRRKNSYTHHASSSLSASMVAGVWLALRGGCEAGVVAALVALLSCLTSCVSIAIVPREGMWGVVM